MNTYDNKAFSTIESANGSIKCWVGKPDNEGKLCLTFSFNHEEYTAFTEALDRIPFLEIENKGTHVAISYVIVRLTERNSLSKLIEILPELIYTHIDGLQDTQANKLAMAR